MITKNQSILKDGYIYIYIFFVQSKCLTYKSSSYFIRSTYIVNKLSHHTLPFKSTIQNTASKFERNK